MTWYVWNLDMFLFEINLSFFPMPRRGLANPHGFDHSRNHKAGAAQLRGILPAQELDDEGFKVLRTTLNELRRKHLDAGKTGSAQRDKMEAVIRTVKKDFPGIFSGEERDRRAYYILQILLESHRNARSTQIRKNKGRRTSGRKKKATSKKSHFVKNAVEKGRSRDEKENTPEVSVLSASLREPDDLTLPSEQENTNEREPTSQEPQMDDESSQKSTTLSDMKAANLSSQTHTSQASFSLQSTSKSTRGFSAKIVSASQTSARSSESTAITVTGTTQIPSVLAFLEACIPSMGHLLDRFTEFGCVNEEFLFGASRWPANTIQNFLESLPPGPEGEKLTKMEVLALQIHLKTYFQS
ncbi:unnamed protein product [Cyclocybe aegerita]|uniref:Uncharacterized protein n=1 Tax=Cyclocybe aegerita TaxID=1973307 RepID=A0A8S0VRL0_CYCAE|nr:unnamed protein product [Cyclocybe aegerita]